MTEELIDEKQSTSLKRADRGHRVRVYKEYYTVLNSNQIIFFTFNLFVCIFFFSFPCWTAVEQIVLHKAQNRTE